MMQVIEEPEELAEDLCEARCSDLEQRRADRYFHVWDFDFPAFVIWYFDIWVFIFGILIFGVWVFGVQGLLFNLNRWWRIYIYSFRLDPTDP